jgi:hypothetical protein
VLVVNLKASGESPAIQSLLLTQSPQHVVTGKDFSQILNRFHYFKTWFLSFIFWVVFSSVSDPYPDPHGSALNLSPGSSC